MSFFNWIVVRKEVRTIKTNKDAAARAYAVWRLGKMGKRARRAIPALIQMFRDWEQLDHEHFSECPPYERTMPSKVAVGALVSIGVSALEPLITALKSKESKIRWLSVDALGQIGDPRAIEPLISTLGDQDWNVDREVPTALDAIDPNWRSSEAAKRMVPQFINLLDDMNHLIKGGAAFALGVIRDTRAVPKLIEVLRDEEGYVSTNAAEALGKIGDPKAVEALLTLLATASGGLKAEAAKALGAIGDSRALEPLINALGDREVCAEVARALGKMHSSQAVKPLLKVLRNPRDGVVQSSVIEALCAITGKKFTLSREWFDWERQTDGIQ